MNDPTEQLRRERMVESAADAGSRKALETRYGQVGSTAELTKDFEVIGFATPLVVVWRKADGKKGSLEFQPHSRLYFNFVAHHQR